MKVLLEPNFRKPNSVLCTLRAAEKLVELGALPMLDRSTGQQLGEPPGCLFGSLEELVSACDMMMAIGGDGTILRVIQHAVPADKPVIGVNAGRIGFLAQIEMDELAQLGLLVAGRYRISRRMLLEAEVVQEGGGRRLALNEVVVAQGRYGKLAELSVTQEGREIALQRAEGMIFSTPTGSTAYSLAAGGSIADPETDLILMTAISPYSAFNRSLILPADKEYLVWAESGAREGLRVIADGKTVANINRDGYVVVRRSPLYARLVDLQLRDFYSNLREKLSLRR